MSSFKLKLATLLSFLLLNSLILCTLSEEDGEGEVEVEDTSSPEEEPIEEVEYRTPELEQDKYHFYESFDSESDYAKRWIKSQATKAESSESQYDGSWSIVNSHPRIKGDMSMMMTSKARHHAIGSKLVKPFNFDGQNFVLQYEVQFRNGQECGGAYIKLLASPSTELKLLNDKSAYSIMFGPDMCGNDYKLHFIFMHKNPNNGTLREIHYKKSNAISKLSDSVKDGKWHLFRLVVRPDNTFQIEMDKKIVAKGNLLEDFTPSVNPPKEIDDPNDTKPEDWDEREKIPDPDSTKPDDWDEDQPRKIADSNAVIPSDWLEDEPEMVPDPEATKPADWDPEMDGEWEPPLIANEKCAKVSGCGSWKAPLIDNPLYKGKWRPPLVNNPNYKGKWAPRKIRNPEFFEDLEPYKMMPIDALAFELWTISDNIAFDNILLTSSVDTANYVSDLTFQMKKDVGDAESDNWLVKTIKHTNKNPWLWAVYLLAIAIPVILFIGFCCVTPGKKRDTKAKAKTDEPIAEDDASSKFGLAGDEPTPLIKDEAVASELERKISQTKAMLAESERREEVSKKETEENVDEETEEEEEEQEEEESVPRKRTSALKTKPRKED